MRWQIKVMIALVLGLVGLELATSRAQFGGLGGLGGLDVLFGSKDGRTDPLVLLRRAEVKKELRVTDDQLNKADAAVWEALAKALDSEQLKRLKQIDLQLRDYKAFADVSVQETLKLTKDQKDNIGLIIHDADKELTNMQKDLKGIAAGGIAGLPAGFANMMENYTRVKKETKERCIDVLKNDQRRVWIEMVGDDFKFDVPKFEIPDLKAKKNVKKKGG